MPNLIKIGGPEPFPYDPLVLFVSFASFGQSERPHFEQTYSSKSNVFFKCISDFLFLLILL